MNEQTLHPTLLSKPLPFAKPGPDSGAWRAWSGIVVVMLLTLAMRIWQVCHTEVASRDTLTYIRMAWQLEHGNINQVLRDSPHHPGYPATIMALSWLVRPLAGNDLVSAMQLSAQLVSVLASVLVVIPMFLLGREWFSARVSFWAALLFQCLPACGRVLGDGLSEGLFLLCAATSLFFGTRALRTGSLLGLALSGLAGGLAYLTRPEGAVLVAAFGFVLLLMQAYRSWRCSWANLGLRLTCLTVPALALAVPYMVVIGHFTAKMGPRATMHLYSLESPIGPANAGVPLLPVPNRLLAVWWHDYQGPMGRSAWSVGALAGVLVRAFFFVLWVPTLIGLWRFRGSFAKQPGLWALALVNLAVLAALLRVTLVMGYVSERHVMLVVLCLSYWTAAGIEWLGEGLAAWALRGSWRAAAWMTPQRCSLLLLLLCTVVPLLKCLQPLHDNRGGFRSAGYWVAQHTKPDEPFYDPFGWTYYYAGRIFQEPLPGAGTRYMLPRYVLLEQTGNSHPHLEGWAVAQRLIDEGQGEVVQRWELPRGKGQILLYELTIPPRAPVPIW